MILYTVQPKSVLRELQQAGVYFVDNMERIKYAQYKEIFQQLMTLSGLNFIKAEAPIWCWQSYLEKELTDETAISVIRGTGSGCSANELIYKIAVPDNAVFLTNYYEWSDLMYYKYVEPDETRVLEQWQYLVSKDANTEIVQAIIPEMRKEMVIGVISTAMTQCYAVRKMKQSQP